MAAKTWAGGKRIRQCLVCGCTDERGCPGGCAWGKGNERDLCSQCIRAREDLQSYIEAVNKTTKRSILLLYRLALVKAWMV